MKQGVHVNEMAQTTDRPIVTTSDTDTSHRYYKRYKKSAHLTIAERCAST